MPKITARLRLTKRAVEALEASGADRILWDAELPGFGVRTRDGRKLFVFQYAVRGRTRRMALGEYGTLTCENARTRARTLREQVTAGGDPAEDRQRARDADTMKGFCARFLTQHVAAKSKPTTERAYRTIIDTVLLPRFANVKVAALTRADVQRLHHALKATPYHANRVLAVLSKMMNLAEKWGLRPDNTNPCRHVERYRERRRQRFLSPAELATLGSVLAEVERERVEWPFVVPALRLLIFTGARVSEILTLKWEWVDLERGCLNLPDSKTGAKTIHLNAPALKVLAEIERDPENPHVIRGGQPGSCLVNLKDPWRRIRTRAGLPDVRMHDFRHSFASVLVARGESLYITGKLLGHAQATTTERYAHLSADPLKAAAEAAGAELAAAMTATPDEKGKVVRLKRGA